MILITCKTFKQINVDQNLIQYISIDTILSVGSNLSLTKFKR